MSETPPRDFIRQIIHDDLESGKHDQIVTRFPPEPNGYLHIGHVMSICLNFGVANETDGKTFLRFDDTNPGKESEEYVQAIERDVRWLGFDWDDRLTHASDYFDDLYAFAERLIEKGVAYVDSLSAEEIREYRGTLTEPGKNSPYRDRTVAENLDLFQRMRAGEFADGEHVLRAKIDMTSPIRCRTRLSTLRIHSARWNLRITGRCTTGFSISCSQSIGRGRLSFRD